MASNLTKKIEEIEDTKLKSGELFMYGHCETNGDINAGVCCEEADLEAIESTLQYIMLQTAKVLYDSNPEITKGDVAEILFTLQIEKPWLAHGKAESWLDDGNVEDSILHSSSTSTR